MSFSKAGSIALRCSQSSGCRSRLPRCRKRSIRLVSVAPAVPGSTWPAPTPARMASASARCEKVCSGWAVTFSRGISPITPVATPRNAQIRSSVWAGSSTSSR
jgi:hypothetical protein